MNIKSCIIKKNSSLFVTLLLLKCLGRPLLSEKLHTMYIDHSVCSIMMKAIYFLNLTYYSRNTII